MNKLAGAEKNKSIEEMLREKSSVKNFLKIVKAGSTEAWGPGMLELLREETQRLRNEREGNQLDQ